MILEIKNRHDLTLLEFVMEFKLEEEFKKTFEVPVQEWDGDMIDYDVIETLLEKHRPENNYVIAQHDDVHGLSTILEV